MDKKKALIAGGALAALAAGVYFASKDYEPSEEEKGSVKDKVLSSGKIISKNLEKNLSIKAEPSTALESLAMLESFSPSLMTRSSMHQGVVTAASVMSAKGVSKIIEGITDAVAPREKTEIRKRLGVRATMLATGFAMSRIPKSDDESIVSSSVRTAGQLLEVASIGGLVYDWVSREDYDNDEESDAGLKLIALGGLLTIGVLYRGRRLIEQRRSILDTVPEDPDNKLPQAIAYGFGFLVAGRAIGAAFGTTRDLISNWMGEGPLKHETSRALNVALWGSLAVGAYWAVITKIGKAEGRIEPAYSEVPTNELVSGSEASVVDFENLGVQGRRFATDVVSKDSIKEVMKESRAKDPIRVYVGYDDDPLYLTGRAELALQELKRTKAYDRKYLLLVSPTGTGWIDQTMIESAEYLARGDIATATIQYGKFPSFLATQKVALGRTQFRLLLWGVKLQLDKMPENKRPKVFVFGESLGAWSSSDTIMHMGIEGFDYYGIDKALWTGMPKLAKWSRVEKHLSKSGNSSGTTGIFDNFEQFEKLSEDEKSSLRAVILNHDNDPIAHLHPSILVREPGWLRRNNRGRGVSDQMEFVPIVTFWQTAIDAGNAMRVTPGKFRSHGHDYRADMAKFVSGAFELPATKVQMNRIEKKLQQLEIEREKILKNQD